MRVLLCAFLRILGNELSFVDDLRIGFEVCFMMHEIRSCFTRVWGMKTGDFLLKYGTFSLKHGRF